MRNAWKKAAAISLPAVLSVSLLGGAWSAQLPTAKADSAKSSVQSQSGQGQLKEQVTIRWGANKQYTGEVVNGERSGFGKYTNTYTDLEGLTHKVVYNGNWKHNRMAGQGTRTEKITDKNGTVIRNMLLVGTFENNLLQRGYDVEHVLGDPAYGYTYKNGNMNLYVNKDLVHQWKIGKLVRVRYQKGSVVKEYYADWEATPATEKKRQAAAKYLNKLTAQATPILKEFKKLGDQLPLK